MWYVILAVILIPLSFMVLVKRAEVTFSCLGCGNSITIRTNLVKSVNCHRQGCTAHYVMAAKGTEFKSLKYYNWRQGIQAHAVPPSLLTITTDEEVEED
jgi:hypothetical protein